MKTSVIYTRVSSREQAEGFSIEAQVKACQKKAKDDGYRVLKVFRDEGFTGTSSDRPALQELLNFCKHDTVHAVIIHKLDRFARSIVDHSALRAILLKYGTTLVSCTEQLGNAPHEVFLENIMASMAQYYSDNLKTEVRKGIVERFESGYHLSVAPYGYVTTKESKVMHIVPNEAETIRKIYSLYATGHYSFESIAELLYKKGYTTRQKRKFNKSRIQEILKNVIYEGLVEYKKIGKKVKGLHEPVVSTVIFNLAQQIMAERGNVLLKDKGKYNFLYKGFVSCPECGKTLYAAYSRGGSGKKHLYYCCRSKTHKSVNIKEADVQKAFDKKLEELQIVEGVMEIIDTNVKEVLEKKHRESSKNLNTNENALQDIKKERVDLYKRYRKGEVSEATYKEVESEIEDREAVAQVSVHEEMIDYYDLLSQLRMLSNFGSNISRYWEIANFDRRKEILCSMFTNAPVIKNGNLTNVEISPLYKAFKDFSNQLVLSGRGDST